jgi:hypothetical protein
MPAITSLADGHLLLAQNSVQLPDGGKIVTEVVQVGESNFITANIRYDANGVIIFGTFCGECGGVSVGCVNCPNNDPLLNCVNNTISCYS